MQQPTESDYQVNPQEAMEIHSRAIGSEYYISSDNFHNDDVIYAEDNVCLEICVYGLPEEERDATLQSIAWWHNHGPALVRRLEAAENALLALGTAMANETNMKSPGRDTQKAVLDMMRVAASIKKGREAHAKAE